MAVARGWQGGGNGGLVSNGCTVSVLQDKKGLEMIVVMVAQQCEYT